MSESYNYPEIPQELFILNPEESHGSYKEFLILSRGKSH